MEEELPVNRLCVQVALEQCDVDLLVLLEKRTTDPVLKELLWGGLPAVCAHYGLPLTLTLPELARAYNEMLFAAVEGTLKEKLAYFVQREDYPRIALCLEKGARAKDGAVLAAQMNNQKLFTYFLGAGVQGSTLAEVCNEAAATGNLDLLQFAHAQGAPLSKWTCMAAAQNNHFAVLKWLIEQGTKCNDMVCAYAALNGNLEMLQWAREHNCPWSVYTPCSAAAGGHLEILKWVHEQGCPWNDLTCSNAVKTGHWEILRWAIDHGCPCTEADYAMLSEGV